MDLSTLSDNPQLLQALILQIQEQSAWDKAKIAGQQLKIAGQQTKIERLQDIIAYLRRKMYGPRSERIDDKQLLLFGQSIMPLTSPAPEMPVEVALNRPRGHGRRIIPANLPREIITIDLKEEEKPCPDCGTVRTKIGEEITEQLEFIPAKLFVRKFIRPKYACGKCEAGVAIAEMPLQVVEKGLAGPGARPHRHQQVCRSPAPVPPRGDLHPLWHRYRAFDDEQLDGGCGRPGPAAGGTDAAAHPRRACD